MAAFGLDSLWLTLTRTWGATYVVPLIEVGNMQHDALKTYACAMGYKSSGINAFAPAWTIQRFWIQLTNNEFVTYWHRPPVYGSFLHLPNSQQGLNLSLSRSDPRVYSSTKPTLGQYIAFSCRYADKPWPVQWNAKQIHRRLFHRRIFSGTLNSCQSQAILDTGTGPNTPLLHNNFDQSWSKHLRHDQIPNLTAHHHTPTPTIYKLSYSVTDTCIRSNICWVLPSKLNEIH